MIGAAIDNIDMACLLSENIENIHSEVQGLVASFGETKAIMRLDQRYGPRVGKVFYAIYLLTEQA